MRNDELYHYGTPHYMSQPHSGRYKYGSGKDPYQHKENSHDAKYAFLERYRTLKAAGKSEKQIADEFGLSVDDLRKKNSVAAAAERAANITRAQRLKKKGISNREIGKIMNPDAPYSESTIRGWLKASTETREDKINSIADVLEKRIKKGQMIDVGYGVELDLNVTKTTFDTALKVLKDKGYVVDTIDIPQPNADGKYTTVRVLCPEGTTKKDIWVNRGEIQTLTEYFPKEVDIAKIVQYPVSIDSKRIFVNYTNPDGTGGVEKDGLIELRRNVPDISLGNASYAQVRIAIDDKAYAKGMAIYSDNIPEGYDILVNTNKLVGTPLFKEKGYEGESVFKKLKDDPEMPFGATIKAGGQTYYTDKDGNEKLGVINRLKDEGEWDKHNKSLSSQFLAKQPLKLINQQLDLTYTIKADQYQEILDYTNPVVKRKLLMDFAESCDKDAVELKAAALPRQNSRVLIPVPELKDNEVYAPTYKNGEKLALVRFPHEGTYQIPICIVNNNNKKAKSLIGNAADAIGLNGATASILSGADFDGDAVLTIPVTDKVNVKNQKPLEGLVGFSTTEAYPKYPGMKVMTSKQTQLEMGKISNLITDMTLRNATPEELTRATRHAMVVIDAEKHELNWKQSEKDNAIEALKKKYQKNDHNKKGYGGASTLISKASAEVKINEIEAVNREGKKTYTPDKETGEWFYAPTNRSYSKLKKDSKGNIVKDDDGNPVYEKHYYKTKTTNMALVKDAFELSSGTKQEEAYATYANRMKKMANDARREAMNIEMPKVNASARATYAEEIKSLDAHLALAKSNKPLERQAQIKANVRIEEYKEQNPELKKDKLKKEKAKILTKARLEVGAGKELIRVTDKEWEAIQASAISPTKLAEILNNADMDDIKKRALPKNYNTQLSSTKVSRIKALNASGMTIAEISDSLGVSPSTVSKYLKE